MSNTPKATLNLTAERARNILDGDDLKYKVIRDEMVDKGRWNIVHQVIIQNMEDHRFWRGYYAVGATEYQDQRPWDCDSPDFVEVFPTVQTTIVYK